MNISHFNDGGNNGRVVPAHFPNSHKALDRTAALKASNPQQLL